MVLDFFSLVLKLNQDQFRQIIRMQWTRVM